MSPRTAPQRRAPAPASCYLFISIPPPPLIYLFLRHINKSSVMTGGKGAGTSQPPTPPKHCEGEELDSAAWTPSPQGSQRTLPPPRGCMMPGGGVEWMSTPATSASALRESPRVGVPLSEGQVLRVGASPDARGAAVRLGGGRARRQTCGAWLGAAAAPSPPFTSLPAPRGARLRPRRGGRLSAGAVGAGGALRLER